MFSYTVCTEYDHDIFIRLCKSLEQKIPGIRKVHYAMDVDSTEIQEYSLDKKELLVFNSDDIGAVYIDSEFDIEPYFS